jgi:hypothetical protein
LNEVPNSNKDKTMDINRGHKGTIGGKVQKNVGDKSHKEDVKNNKRNIIHFIY